MRYEGYKRGAGKRVVQIGESLDERVADLGDARDSGDRLEQKTST